MWRQIGALRERGVTIILTTHYIEEAEMMADRVGIIDKGRLLMVDEKAEMMARLGRTEARFTLAEPLAAMPAELAEFPVELESGGLVLCYRGGDGTGKGKQQVAEVSKALIRAGIDYTGIDVHESSLEDIFVQLIEHDKAAA
jgi:ABC-2 type transport system ATP-binding protein